MKKKLFIILLLMFSLFIVGCSKEEANDVPLNETTKDEKNNNDSDLSVGKYKVQKDNNSVIIITNDGSNISRTTYYFENDKVSKAELVEEFTTNSLAETSYNIIKNEPSITNQYSNIKLNGNKIILTVKEEILSAYSTFNYEDFYNLMYDTYKMYIE